MTQSTTPLSTPSGSTQRLRLRRSLSTGRLVRWLWALTRQTPAPTPAGLAIRHGAKVLEMALKHDGTCC